LPLYPGLEAVGRVREVGGGVTVAVGSRVAWMQRRAVVVVDAIRAGWLRMGDGTAYDLGRVADAHRAIEGRGTQGKLYLIPWEKRTVPHEEPGYAPRRRENT
jgi:hypothetical protein